MLTISLEYGENFSESISLNGLLEHEEGVQALSGLVGAGLPPVSVQWLEGAGDGAKKRGRRVLPRPIDLPLYVAATSRRILKVIARELSIALGDTCRLRLRDSEEEFDWIAEVDRTGGGDFVYGEDTTGNYDLSLVITLMAGNPFWLQDRKVRYEGVPAEGTPAILKVNNPGSAPAFATWTLDGPGIDFTITSAKGETFLYEGLVDLGEKRIIDGESATVVDADGVNRYDGVGSASNLFQIPPGRSTVQISVDQSSDAFLVAQGGGRVNYATNPGLRDNADDWTLYSPATYDAGSESITKAAVTDDVVDVGTTTITGLTPGATYRAVLQATSGPLPNMPSGAKKTASAKMIVILYNGTRSIQQDIAHGTAGTFDTTFVAATTSVQFSVRSNWIIYDTSAGVQHQKNGTAEIAGPIFVGDPGPVFDGDTADAPPLAYAWAGTPDASRSSAVTTLTEDDLNNVKVTLELQPRDWMVV